jgi:hypothetical protein
LFTQAPAWQACPAAHARPQAPQFAAEVSRDTSQPFTLAPSQLPKPGAQLIPHDPPTHAGIEPGGTGHTLPQAPQWSTLRLVSLSQPLDSTPSQSPVPAAHDATTQVPATQAGVALVTMHSRPQAPHWSTLEFRSTQTPLHGVWPDGQPVAWQTPAAQVWPAAQALPQRPQLAVLVAVLVSQPLAALPSQSAKVALQMEAHAPSAQREAPLGTAGQGDRVNMRPSVEHTRRVFSSAQLVVPGVHTRAAQLPSGSQ